LFAPACLSRIYGQTARIGRYGCVNHEWTVNFQVTILKVLVSYPGGYAVLADVRRDVAILATSGQDWSERTKRLAERIPGLDIFSQGLVERDRGGWWITDKGRAALKLMEARPVPMQSQALVPAETGAQHSLSDASPELLEVVPPLAFRVLRSNRGRLERHRRRRNRVALRVTATA
jgi:hypothetical protein